MMKSHEPKRKCRTSSDTQRFLRGSLYLPDGRRLCPTYATKGSRRYSYYFAAAESASGGEAVRLPALELERTVVEAVRRLLDNPLQLSEHFSGLLVHDTQRLLAFAQEKALRLSDITTSASRALIRALLRRVTIHNGELSIEIGTAFLLKDMQNSPQVKVIGTPITLAVPFEMRRRGRQVRLVLSGTHSEAEPLSSLVRAVAMARQWAVRIAAGEVFGLNQLALEYGIERSYAQKVLRCAALSPRHIEAVLSGQHRAELTFAVFTANIPLCWQLQRLERSL